MFGVGLSPVFIDPASRTIKDLGDQLMDEKIDLEDEDESRNAFVRFTSSATWVPLWLEAPGHTFVGS